MPIFEVNRREIVARLEREGWINTGGGSHDIFRKPGVKDVVVVPRHREVALGTARSIALAAGWIKRK